MRALWRSKVKVMQFGNGGKLIFSSWGRDMSPKSEVVEEQTVCLSKGTGVEVG
jgi:hypothetical protein